jgi:hypothetical protein
VTWFIAFAVLILPVFATGFRKTALGLVAVAHVLRAPMSLQEMTYDAATGTVICRSKMHVGLKRNFQVMPGAQWLELPTEFAARARAAWTRLLRKVYDADPLECPRCKGPMRMIALIEDPGVIRCILEHLGQWAPLATERSPPPPAASWPIVRTWQVLLRWLPARGFGAAESQVD